MKFRPVRGSLKESMRDAVEVTDMMDLWALVRSRSKDWPGYRDCVFQDLKVEPYGRDERIGWDTYIVTLRGSAVGYTDGPVPPAPEAPS
jgi:hypothetical protein